MDFLSEIKVFVISILTLAFVSYLIYALKIYQNVGERKKLPPGPWKLPLIGNMHQLLGGLPHHVFRNLAAKHGELMHLQLGEIPLPIVSSPRLAKEVLKTRDPVFAGRPQLLGMKVMFYDFKDIVGHTYDEYWQQMRKIWSHEFLNAKTVRSLARVRLDEGDRLISLARDNVGKSFNMTETITRYTTSVVCRAAIGRVSKDQDLFIELLPQVTRLASSFDIADLFPSLTFLRFLSGKMPKLLKIHRKIDAFLDDKIQEHIRNFNSTGKCNGEGGEEDIMDILLRIKDSNNLKIPITNINIKAILFNVFTGGIETSSAVTVWAMSELMRSPQVLEKAQQEIQEAFDGKESIDEADISELKYLYLVIKETLRLHPPAPLLFPRESLEDCSIDGYTIPARTTVMVNAWAIGRDRSLWTDPESFIPERFEDSVIDVTGNKFELIPFGSGKRICPGIALGLANIKLPLALLLYHFNWSLPGGLEPDDLDMTESDGPISRKKVDLCLIPSLRSTSVDRP